MAARSYHRARWKSPSGLSRYRCWPAQTRAGASAAGLWWNHLVRVWRLVRKRRLPSAFGGEGSKIAGGRWNNPGIPVVYTSSSLSLATLEYLTRASALRAPQDVCSIWADVPDDLPIETI